MRAHRALLLVSALPLVLSGCDVTYAAIDKVEGRTQSPFMLFMREDMRPGVRWATLAQHTKDETPMETVCTPFPAHGQRCAVQIQPGVLIVIVDGSGRIVRLVVHTDRKIQYGGMSADVGRQLATSVDDMRDAWSKVGKQDETQVVLGAYPTGIGAVQVTHWVDPDAHWFATMWTTQQVSFPAGIMALARLSGIGTPDSITITDLQGWAAMREIDSSIPKIETHFKQARAATSVVNRDSVARDSVKQVAAMPPERAIEMMEYDLRALTMQQESWMHAHQAYATRLDMLHAVASAGVRLELLQPTERGWSARATHEAVEGASCVVFSGEVARVPATQRTARRPDLAGTIVCDPR